MHMKTSHESCEWTTVSMHSHKEAMWCSDVWDIFCINVWLQQTPITALLYQENISALIDQQNDLNKEHTFSSKTVQP